MSDLRAQIGYELEQLRVDTYYTEKAHFAAATDWGSARTGIGAVTTLAGAASTATIIADQLPALAAVFAVIATIGGALQTFLKPGERAQSALKAGRDLGAVRVQMRQAQLLKLPATDDRDLNEVVKLASDLAAAKAEIDSLAPAVSNRHYNKGMKQIESGGPSPTPGN
jgi:hypothetical protein